MFVVKHEHRPRTCPARNLQMGQMLLKHVSASNAKAMGVTIRSEAVIDGGHAFYLVVTADGKGMVEKFMAPFAQAGTVEIWPANTFEAVVARAGC